VTAPPLKTARTHTNSSRYHLGLALLASLGLSVAFAQESGALTLAAALERLPQSPDWQIADLTYAASERALENARAASNLSVNAGGSYGLTRQTNEITTTNPVPGGAPIVVSEAGNVTSNANVSANASINVLPWSNAQVQARSSELALQRAVFDRSDARKNLMVNATNQYFLARIAATDLELAKSNEGLSEARLKIANQQQTNGQITREQLLGTQQALENAKVNTMVAKNTLELARLSLFNTLGLSPNETSLSTPPSEYAMPKTTLEALLKEALEKRGDVQKAKLRVQEAEEGLQAAQLNRWLPNSNINLGYGVQGNSGPNINGGLNIQSGVASVSTTYPVYQNPEPKSTNPALTFSVSVLIPILAPSQDAQVGTAQTNLETARKTLESAKRGAELDVRQKYNDASIATQRLSIAKLGLQSLEFGNQQSQTNSGNDHGLGRAKRRTNRQASRTRPRECGGNNTRQRHEIADSTRAVSVWQRAKSERNNKTKTPMPCSDLEPLNSHHTSH
jgi:outer membrane protein